MVDTENINVWVVNFFNFGTFSVRDSFVLVVSGFATTNKSYSTRHPIPPEQCLNRDFPIVHIKIG